MSQCGDDAGLSINRTREQSTTYTQTPPLRERYSMISAELGQKNDFVPEVTCANCRQWQLRGNKLHD